MSSVSASIRAAIVLVLLIGTLAVACTGSAPSTPAPGTARPERTESTPTPSAAANGARPSQAAAAPPVALIATALPVAPGITVFQQSGDGSSQPSVGQQTAPFTVAGSWDLHWSYDCGGSGRQGNLGIDVFRSDGSFVSEPTSLNLVGSGGQGVQQYNVSGSFYLVINSVCRWSVSVSTAARPTATPIISSAAPAPAATGGASNLGATFSPPTAAAAASTPRRATQAQTGGAGTGGGAGPGVFGISIAPAIGTSFAPAFQTPAGFAGGAGSFASATPASTAQTIAPVAVATPSATP